MPQILKNIKSEVDEDVVFDVIIDFNKIDKQGVFTDIFPIQIFLNLKEKTIGWKIKKGEKIFGDYEKII